jgi:hypothetical protein
MAERNATIIEFPRGKYIGHRVCDLAKEEHYYRCPACGAWLDCRDPHRIRPKIGANII